MRFLIVGPGAMGCLFACVLKRAGYEVEILDYVHVRAKRLSEHGLKLEGVSGEYQVKLPVSVGIPQRMPDVILVCVKAYKTFEASKQIKSALKEVPLVVTLQNGVGNLEILEEVLGKGNVTAGVTSEGATLLGEGHVRHAGKGETIVGRGPVSEDKIEAFVKAFNDAGINTRWQEDVTGLIWGKLLVNVGINPLTAILRVKNGVLCESEHTRRLMRLLVEEALKVAQKKGIALPFENPVEKVYEVARNTAQNISSMLQDMLKGKSTEIAFICGAIVTEGAKLGIKTPYNEAMLRLVAALEETRELRIS